jgi:ABC-type multidrug transport system permease subunit
MIFKKLFRYKNIFWQLLKTDLIILKKTLLDKVFNSTIWVSTTIIVSDKLLPLFGMSNEFAPLIALGSVASCSGFELFPKLAATISDFEGDRHISYKFTLPIPNWLLFIEMSCEFVVNSLIIMTTAFTVTKILLWSRIVFFDINFLQLLLSSFFISIFFSFFTFWVISLTKSMLVMDNVFMRFIYPLWFLGGYQFTWKSLHKVSPICAYLNLLNPYTCSIESIRAAVLGSQGYLSFWFCSGALIFLSIIFGFWGILRLKRRLDFV